jgi:hypothetical protein
VIVKHATCTHWGIAGYLLDPDGHLFEVDYEDVWVLDQDNHLSWIASTSRSDA